MPKSRIFQVINDRVRFICSHCGARRNMQVPPQLRRKSIRCFKCSEPTRCQFNRRLKHREQKSGKIILITNSGEELIVNLQDFSPEGLGIEVPPGFTIASKFKLRNTVRVKSSWNLQISDIVDYEVRNIFGRRVGLKRKMY